MTREERIERQRQADGTYGKPYVRFTLADYLELKRRTRYGSAVSNPRLREAQRYLEAIGR
jgi:hypothetical protein